ncbi:hypothetical protein SAMN05216266_107122 [Amycolatopsis marina]|uniref:Uncharacterized protein n=1 Tax=Amycolatopsis marina TaxID=490629 RepID=A0A1I0ZQQ9_9PSEU|nr:hypothetical protein [Amycolatopsis marina]SFB26800.1 hypothetical protein SAMN05216266_107122 [Amycolatopsis marina]
MADSEQAGTSRTPLLVFVWLWVALPFAYGVFELVRKVIQLFGA